MNLTLCQPQAGSGRGGRPASSRSRLMRSRPFAGELDDDGEFHDRTWHLRKNASSCISGTMTFLPGTRNVCGLGFQQALKTAERVKNLGPMPPGKRGLSKRLIDPWGNMKTRDLETTQTVANMYLATVHSNPDLDMTFGIGKSLSIPPVERVPSATQEQSQRMDSTGRWHRQVPQLSLPPRVMGHTGHYPRARDFVGVSFNKIQMSLHPSYAAARNFESLQPADKVPTARVRNAARP
ncbi:hypothetical protein DIPPA_07613 [Diplonema papillatum]|nr:hypothetical protein DIPPA_07613 [Diplonema papillatum]